MSSDGQSAIVSDKNDKDIEFKGVGRRLGTSEDTKKANEKKDNEDMTKSGENDLVKKMVEAKGNEVEEGSEGIVVDVNDISDSETGNYEEPFEGTYQPHNAGKPVKKKEVTGLRSEAKTLYEGPRKCTCCVNWVEKPPVDAHPKSSAEHGDYALLVRRTAHGQDRAWKIQSMMVYSPYVMEMLRTTLKDYPGLALALDQLPLNEPFQPLLHRWKLIDKALKAEDNWKARNHYNLFRQVIEPELKIHLQARDDAEEHGVIPFASIWTIFEPGNLVYWEADGQAVVGRLLQASFTKDMIGSELYSLSCEQVDWNGEIFGFRKKAQKIDFFEGTRPVDELSVVPLSFKSNANTVRSQIINRGRKFESLRGYSFKVCDGPALGSGEGVFGFRDKSCKKINDRVIVDANSYYQFQELPPLILSPLNLIKAAGPSRHKSLPRVSRRGQGREGRESSHGCVVTNYYEDDQPYYEEQRPAKIEPLTDDQLILCVPWVRGFVLKEKRWYQLAVDGIKDISWNDSFSNLVLPNQEKDLLLAFAQSKINTSSADGSSSDVFDDFVDGKGRGVIILLSGSPGVGKTLTAESIAEKMKVPLYTLSAGEIGIIPTTVETKIKTALEKCTKWNAILLLDEADVFLEKRELNSLKRNELVSIFLRQLEYYEGMMFLTTNRVNTIDPAFESRIDVSINYPDLTEELRFQIWTKFLSRMERTKSGLDLTEADLRPLAQLDLNGRQIKSTVKTAQLLANSKTEKLSVAHLTAVLRLQRTAY